MPKKVLVIEDTDDIRDALKGLIEFQGYDVIVAANGVDGVRLAMTENPDLILMDIAMPGTNGIEATRQIRAARQNLDIPIIAVTSFAGDYSRDALAAGMTEIYTKSSFIDAYESVLTNYLD